MLTLMLKIGNIYIKKLNIYKNDDLGVFFKKLFTYFNDRGEKC